MGRWLQWGRDRSIAELPPEPGTPFRELRCFNGAAIDRARKYAGVWRMKRLRKASMGPRSIDRGTNRKGLVGIGRVLLQWGRDRSIAELTAGDSRWEGISALQWGRDRSIAE